MPRTKPRRSTAGIPSDRLIYRSSRFSVTGPSDDTKHALFRILGPGVDEWLNLTESIDLVAVLGEILARWFGDAARQLGALPDRNSLWLDNGQRMFTARLTGPEDDECLEIVGSPDHGTEIRFKLHSSEAIDILHDLNCALLRWVHVAAVNRIGELTRGTALR